MNSQKPHRNLIAWQKAMDFAVNVYELTRNFPQGRIVRFNCAIKARKPFRVLQTSPKGLPVALDNNSRTICPTLLASLKRDRYSTELALRLGYLTATGYERLISSTR